MPAWELFLPTGLPPFSIVLTEITSSLQLERREGLEKRKLVDQCQETHYERSPLEHSNLDENLTPQINSKKTRTPLQKSSNSRTRSFQKAYIFATNRKKMLRN
jgi:hypothetical protein